MHTRSAAGSAAGKGRATGHHGEVLQGVFALRGRLSHGLVTLPCPLFQAQVDAVLVSDTRAVTVAPAWKVKAATAARLLLDTLQQQDTGAQLVVRGAIPVCRGFGSSTSDVVATVRAILAATGAHLDEAGVANVSVRSEVASDPLMFERAVLFAQRDGVVLEDFAVPFPSFEVLGFSSSTDGLGISTLEFPAARYSADEVKEFDELKLRLRDALSRGAVNAVGDVASASARLNRRHIQIPQFAALEQIVRDVGAMGLQVAHSGDVAGLLFDRKDSDLEDRMQAAGSLLATIDIVETWRFNPALARER